MKYQVFVFKLYPKLVNYKPDPSTLQCAMQGTVSTYNLDTDGMAQMIGGI